MTMLSELSNSNILIEAFRKSQKASSWKESTQRYEINLLKNIRKTQIELKTKTYQQGQFYEFNLLERGHKRHIRAIHIYDRVVQRALCDIILCPCIRKHLIYDNGASLKDKGLTFTRKRLDKHLRSFYKKNKTEGYILQIDFSKFFDNIHHEKIIKMLAGVLDDPDIISLLENLIDSFKIDISYSNKDLLGSLFNILEYNQTIPPNKRSGTRYMRKSLGIGSQISQLSGLLYPSRIDNYCKIVKRCKFYGRYMDDIYIIHQDKKFLQDLLQDISRICSGLGIFINPKKTHILKLKNGFTFLKTRYYITESGKIIKKYNPKNITRERQKLKKFYYMNKNGKISLNEIENQYKSWRGTLKKYNSYRSLRNLDKLYTQLFGGE